MPFFKDLAARFAAGWKELRCVPSLAGSALMTALNVVLNSVTVAVSNVLEIGFAGLSIAAAAYLYGPWLAAMAGVAADILGYILRPAGPFFIGFTFNELLRGLVLGAWLYKKPVSLPRIIGACVSVTLLLSFVLNPIWLHAMYGAALFSVPRMVTALVKLPVDIALYYALLKALERLVVPRLRKN